MRARPSGVRHVPNMALGDRHSRISDLRGARGERCGMYNGSFVRVSVSPRYLGRSRRSLVCTRVCTIIRGSRANRGIVALPITRRRERRAGGHVAPRHVTELSAVHALAAVGKKTSTVSRATRVLRDTEIRVCLSSGHPREHYRIRRSDTIHLIRL